MCVIFMDGNASGADLSLFLLLYVCIACRTLMRMRAHRSEISTRLVESTTAVHPTLSWLLCVVGTMFNLCVSSSILRRHSSACLLRALTLPADGFSVWYSSPSIVSFLFTVPSLFSLRVSPLNFFLQTPYLLAASSRQGCTKVFDLSRYLLVNLSHLKCPF